MLKADQIVSEILSTQNKITQKIVENFGEEITAGAGSSSFIDKSKLGQIVFSDPKSLKNLEKIIHPAVKNIFQKKVSEKEKLIDFVFYEIPLLFETKQEQNFDFVCVVFCEDNIRIKRLKEREPKLTEKEILCRFNSQIKQVEKISKAHFLINNSLEFENTERQVKALISSCLSLEKSF